MLFDKLFVSLTVQCVLEHCLHREDERQAHGYLILKIWTIFKSIQITSNGAHANDCMSSYRDGDICQKRELFTCYLWMAVQSLSMIASIKLALILYIYVNQQINS